MLRTCPGFFHSYEHCYLRDCTLIFSLQNSVRWVVTHGNYDHKSPPSFKQICSLINANCWITRRTREEIQATRDEHPKKNPNP